MQRTEDQKKAAKARADETQLRQSCADIRAQLRILASDQPMARINERGETVFVDDATRSRERERIEALLRERCSG
jgi:outer membrane protein TolC